MRPPSIVPGGATASRTDAGTGLRGGAEAFDEQVWGEGKRHHQPAWAVGWNAVTVDRRARGRAFAEHFRLLGMKPLPVRWVEDACIRLRRGGASVAGGQVTGAFGATANDVGRIVGGTRHQRWFFCVARDKTEGSREVTRMDSSARGKRFPQPAIAEGGGVLEGRGGWMEQWLRARGVGGGRCR